MKISILTLFTEMFEGPFNHSIIKRAIEKQIVSIETINIRDFGLGKHRIVDDKPYGGGSGMLLRVDVVEKTIENTKCKTKCKEKIILLGARGKQFNQKKAKSLTKYEHLILICGHYEGLDERIREYIDEELSIGDYVLTGGEIPAMVITDAVVRLLPNVLGKADSSTIESFQEIVEEDPLTKQKRKYKVLEYPQYTRPEEYKNKKVPKVLLSGNHEEIEKWRKKESTKLTQKIRPDLLKPRKI